MAKLQGNPKPVDPNTSLPPAIRRQREETEARIAAEAAARQDPPQRQPEPPQPAPEPPQPVVERLPTPEPQRPPEPPQPSPEPGSEPREDDQTWEQRFKSEQGRTRKLTRQLTEMADTLHNMERLIATMQAQPAPAPASDVRFEELLTPEEKQDWGEMLPIVEKKAREIVGPLEAELKSKLKQLDDRLGQMGETQVQDAKSRMLQALDNHPVIGVATGNSYRDLNNDERFVGWLQQIDRRSRRTLQSLLQEAFNSNDAARVATFFEDFLQEVAPPTDPTREPSPPAQPGKVSLEALAAPGRGPRAPAPPPGPAQKPTFTTGDIAQFYADKTANRFRGREDEAKRIEADIFEAQNEGRVVAGPPQKR